MLTQNDYVDLAAPISGNVMQVLHSTTAARYKIPPHWRGKIITFTSSTSDMFVLFGSANVMIEAAEVSVVVGEEIGSNWASGALIPAGGSLPIPVSRDSAISHFAVDSATGGTGYWTAHVSSGTPAFGGEPLPSTVAEPALWVDAGFRHLINVDAGAVTVASAKCRSHGYMFTGSNKPDLFTAAAAASGMVRPTISFVAGSTEKLISTSAPLAAALGSNGSFTIGVSLSRGVTGAAHTILSVGTSGSANGHWDLTMNASDDLVMTRVDAAGNSATATYAATLSGAYSFVLTYDGTTNVLYVDNTAVTFTASGTFASIGTPTNVAIGSRFINATYDQYATMELSDLVVIPVCLTGAPLADFQAYYRRRTGK